MVSDLLMDDPVMVPVIIIILVLIGVIVLYLLRLMARKRRHDSIQMNRLAVNSTLPHDDGRSSEFAPPEGGAGHAVTDPPAATFPGLPVGGQDGYPAPMTAESEDDISPAPTHGQDGARSDVSVELTEVPAATDQGGQFAGDFVNAPFNPPAGTIDLRSEGGDTGNVVDPAALPAGSGEELIMEGEEGPEERGGNGEPDDGTISPGGTIAEDDDASEEDIEIVEDGGSDTAIDDATPGKGDTSASSEGETGTGEIGTTQEQDEDHPIDPRSLDPVLRSKRYPGVLTAPPELDQHALPDPESLFNPDPQPPASGQDPAAFLPETAPPVAAPPGQPDQFQQAPPGPSRPDTTHPYPHSPPYPRSPPYPASPSNPAPVPPQPRPFDPASVLPQPVGPGTQQQVWTCSGCGKQTDIKFMFCTECGHKRNL